MAESELDDPPPEDGVASPNDAFTAYQEAVDCGFRTISSTDGRLTLPHEAMRECDLERGDVVDMVLNTGDDVIVCLDRPVRGKRRVAIPQWKRERHDLDGESVQVTLFVPNDQSLR